MKMMVSRREEGCTQRTKVISAAVIVLRNSVNFVWGMKSFFQKKKKKIRKKEKRNRIKTHGGSIEWFEYCS